jgi:hypothetical protein
VTPSLTPEPTITPTPSITPSPIPTYWQAEALVDCCTDFSSGPWNFVAYDGSSPQVGDTIAIELDGGGTRCYQISGSISPSEGPFFDFMVQNYGNSNCFTCTQTYICPSVTPTPTLTTTPTPTNPEIAYGLLLCSDEPQIIIGNFAYVGEPTPGQVLFVTGTEGVKACYTVTEAYEGGATFTVQTVTSYKNCAACKDGPIPTPSITPTRTPSATPAASITPTRTKTPTPTRTNTPTRTVTPTRTPTPTNPCQYWSVDNFEQLSVTFTYVDCTGHPISQGLGPDSSMNVCSLYEPGGGGVFVLPQGPCPFLP